MTWKWLPWRRQEETPDDDADLAAAREARQRAEEILSRVTAQRRDVDRMVRSLRRIRQQNHLIDIVEASIRDRRGDGRA
jgi:hypothetical protein